MRAKLGRILINATQRALCALWRDDITVFAVGPDLTPEFDRLFDEFLAKTNASKAA